MKYLATFWRTDQRAAIALLLGLLCSSVAFGSVATEAGQVEGTNQDGMTVYRGIPFAAPPVGDLRWRAPQAAAKWTGVKTANAFAPACTGGGSPSGIRTQGAAKGKPPLRLRPKPRPRRSRVADPRVEVAAKIACISMSGPRPSPPMTVCP